MEGAEGRARREGHEDEGENEGQSQDAPRLARQGTQEPPVVQLAVGLLGPGRVDQLIRR